MQRYMKITNSQQEKSYFEFTTEIPTTLSPTSLCSNIVVCGSQILKISAQWAEKVSKFAYPANSAALRSDENLMAATHANSISISATRYRAMLKQFKTPSPPQAVCFVGLSKVACGTQNGELVVWDLGIQEVVFAVYLGIEIFVLLEHNDNVLCFGQHYCMLCNLNTKEVYFLGKKRYSASEYYQLICEFPGKAYAALRVGDSAVLCTDLGLSLIDVKQQKLVKNLSVLKGISYACCVDGSLLLSCFDGCIRRCSLELDRLEVLERLRYPIFYISHFKIDEASVICVATNQPRITLFSRCNFMYKDKNLKKFDPFLLNEKPGYFVYFPRPEVLPDSIEMLMRSHTYGKALEVALQQHERQTVLNILYDVCYSNEKALASSVFYLSDEAKIILYKLFLESFGTRDFAVFASAIHYYLSHTGFEQGVLGSWHTKIMAKIKQWEQLDDEYDVLLNYK